jgi:hypothetical protein
MRFGYAMEKCGGAARTLATSGEPLRVRLGAAINYNVGQIFDLPDNPKEIQDDLKKIATLVSGVEAKGDEGDSQAAINMMNLDQQQVLARLIFDLHVKVAHAYGAEIGPE